MSSGANLVIFFIVIISINNVVSLREIDWQSKLNFKNKFDKISQAIKERVSNLLSRAPKEDIEHIELDEEGAPYFVDSFTYNAADSKKQKRFLEEIHETSQAINAFTLHSCPTCITKIYLDFTGETVVNSAWSSGSGTLTGAPFTCDSTPGSFSTWENTVIQDIWARVAEDYRPFQVDVTTEPPAGAANTWAKTVLHAVITKSDPTLPSYTAGGIGYVGIFNISQTYYYRPCWIYYDRLGGANNTVMVANAVSHELGHNFGLSHDGIVASGSTPAQSYYGGHGSGATAWAPLMGSSSRALTQWSKGEYPLASNTEDDMLIISRQVGYVAATTTLTLSTVAGCDAYYSGNSVITNANAEDVWSLVLSPPATYGASITVNATPWYSTFKPSDVSFNGNNLDISLSIGSLNSAPLGVSTATLSVGNIATSSQIKVRGSGETSSTTSFSTYGSVGWYKLSICARWVPLAGCTSGACCDTATGLTKSSGVVCSASTGPCEAAGVCDGISTSCPAKYFYPTTQVCRAKAGDCDAAETCPGNSAACPSDTLLPSGTVCRASAGVCDNAEVCSGTSSACPNNAFKPSTTVCRASAGPCDVIDYCSGSSGTCGPDYISVGSTCRASTGPCDPAEKCTGAGYTCPNNVFLAAGTACKKTNGANGSCSGTSGTCV